jgi:hypothetical protein
VIDLRGYFDESGTHWQSEIIVVGGYVNPARDWRRLEIKWRKALEKADVPYFHATDLEANPPRGVYKGWSRAEADKFVDRMTRIASEYAGRAFGVHIKRVVWLQAMAFIVSELENRPHKLPFFVAAKNCIDVVVDEAASRLPEGESVGFVFEENDYKKAMMDGYDLAKQSHPKSDRFGTLAFACKERFAGLQAADLFAWHYRKIKEAELTGRRRIHRWAKMVIKPDNVYREVTLELLEKIIRYAIAGMDT